MTNVRMDPYRTYNFRLEIDNLSVAAFSEASGLTSDGDVVDYRTGVDVPQTARKLPGQRKFGPITLKRGVINAPALNEWLKPENVEVLYP